jgi:hypothetical protein
MVTTSTLTGSTNTFSNASFSSITGSSILFSGVTNQTLTGTTFIGSTLFISVLTGTSLQSERTQCNMSLLANRGSTSINNMTITNLYGTTFIASSINSNTISSNQVSATYASTNTLYTNQLSASSFSTQTASYLYGFQSSIRQNNISVCTMITSTLSTTNITFSVFTANAPLNINIVGDIINYSNMFGSSLLNSTFTGSTTNILTLSTSFLNYSTCIGSTFATSTLLGSSLSISSIFGSTLYFSTLSASTASISTMSNSTCYVSSLSGSTIRLSTITESTLFVSTLNASTMSGSTFFGSTLFVSRLTVSSVLTSSLIISTLIFSSLTGSTTSLSTVFLSNGFYSTITGSTITVSSINVPTVLTSTAFISTGITSSLVVSNLNTSTLFGNSLSFPILNASTILLSTLSESTIFCGSTTTSLLYVSSITGSTFSVSTLIVSSINNITVGLGSGNQVLNTAVGYAVLSNNTTGNNNSAFGSQALSTNTSGVYQVALGASTLSQTTFGSYTTAIGSGAGVLSGFAGSYNTYIGYNAVPSGISATNEIVIGGAAIENTTNVGNGNNTMILGNSYITKTIFYGSVGIGTSVFPNTLNVIGSYQQIGGSMSITYSQANAFSQLFIYSDGAAGCGMFLNGASRGVVDGGNQTGTFRNDYGTLRLQSKGTNGITILANGNVGFNTVNPTSTLSIIGNVKTANTPTVNTLNVTSLLNNGVTINLITPWFTSGSMIYHNGSVGIGTSTVSYTLDVSGSGYHNATLNVTNTTTATTSMSCTSISSNNTSNTPNSVTTNTLTGNASANVLASASIGVRNLLVPNVDYFPNINNFYATSLNGKQTYTSNPRTHIFPYMPQTSAGYEWFTTPYRWGMSGDLSYDANRLYIIKYGSFSIFIGINGSAWSNLSDIRIKNTIQPINSILETYLLLNPVTYYLNCDIECKWQCIGLIAQDVQRLFPHLVSKSKLDQYDFDVLTLTYTPLIIYSIKALQELHSIILSQGKAINNIPYISMDPIHDQMTEIDQQLSSHESRIKLLEAKFGI